MRKARAATTKRSFLRVNWFMHTFAFWKATWNHPVSRRDRGERREPEDHTTVPRQGPCPASCEATGWRSTSTPTAGFYPMCPDTCLPLKQRTGISTAWTSSLPRSHSGGWGLRKPAHIWDEDLHASPTAAACQPPPGSWKMLQATRTNMIPLSASQT